MKTRHLSAVTLCTLLTFIIHLAAAAPGDLDTTFGTGGKVTTAIGSGDDHGRSVALQPDGKIVVAGYLDNGNGSDHDVALLRYTVNGALDPTFSGDGIVTTAIGSSGGLGHVVIQPDGKIVVAGTADDSDDDFLLLRYKADGTLDTTFGTGGIVTTDIVGGRDTGESVALQTDGKIVVAGSSWTGSTNDFALLRYEADGTLDTTFGTGGKVTTAIGSGSDFGLSVAMQSDGKIVVAGWSDNGSDDDVALLRYTVNGTLDPTFGGDGIVTTDFGDDDRAFSVLLQPDGKIVVAGYSKVGPDFDFLLSRYEADGTWINAFGTDFGNDHDYGMSIALQPDGKIVVAGWSSNQSSNENVSLLRHEADGTVDAGFGTGGKVTTAIGSDFSSVHSVVLQTDGKIVVTGDSKSGSDDDVALLRYEGGAVQTAAVLPPVDPNLALKSQLARKIKKLTKKAKAAKKKGKLALAKKLNKKVKKLKQQLAALR